MKRLLSMLVLVAAALGIVGSFTPNSRVRSDADGTDSPTCADETVLYGLSTTVTLPDADTQPCSVGASFSVCTTGSYTLTVNRAGADTINGTTTASLVGVENSCWTLTATGATAWRSLQYGSSAVANAGRIAIVSGVPYLTAGTYLGGTFTATGAATAATSSADPNAFGATMSGANLTVNAATAVAGNNDVRAQYWSWLLSSAGLDIPDETRVVRLITSVSSFTEGARTASSVSSVGISLGTAAQTNVRTVAFLRPGSGTGYNNGRISGSGTYSSTTGSATVTMFDTALTIGDVTGTESLIVRLNGTDIESGIGGPSTGGIVATVPTYLNLYVQVTGANTLEAWTLNDLAYYVRW
jgi:hypothetical protein